MFERSIMFASSVNLDQNSFFLLISQDHTAQDDLRQNFWSHIMLWWEKDLLITLYDLLFHEKCIIRTKVLYMYWGCLVPNIRLWAISRKSQRNERLRPRYSSTIANGFDMNVSLSNIYTSSQQKWSLLIRLLFNCYRYLERKVSVLNIYRQWQHQ